MKQCKKCGVEKPRTEFYAAKGPRDGLRGSCKLCYVAAGAAWAKRNPQVGRAAKARYYVRHRTRVLAATKARYSNNKVRAQEYVRMWRKANPEKVRQYNKYWVQANSGAVVALLARHKAQKLRATPAWANQFFIDEIYDLAALRTKLLGARWEVDHIVPLRSPHVCGLHVEHNLRVVPKLVNRQKNNRYWPDMPETRA